MIRSLTVLFCVCLYLFPEAQTIGGSSIFNFLKLPQHALVAASGGRTVSSLSNEVGLLSENPAFLNALNHGDLSSNVTVLSPGITMVNATGALHLEKINTTLALSINHLSYGIAEQTDAGGNVMGTFAPFDQFVQLSASHKYGSRWNYGASLKYVASRYGIYSSKALAMDMGITFQDEEKGIHGGFAAKNMGIQLKTYAGQGEDLPFDISAGISKKLENAPLRFTLTAQKMHQLDILYNDTLFSTSNGLQQHTNGFLNKLISHAILSGDLLLGDKVVVTLGYNFLRRKELVVERMANGLTGFSYGMTLKFKRMTFYFSRAHYQSSLAYINAGITCNLSKFRNN